MTLTRENRRNTAEKWNDGVLTDARRNKNSENQTTKRHHHHQVGSGHRSKGKQLYTIVIVINESRVKRRLPSRKEEGVWTKRHTKTGQGQTEVVRWLLRQTRKRPYRLEKAKSWYTLLIGLLLLQSNRKTNLHLLQNNQSINVRISSWITHPESEGTKLPPNPTIHKKTKTHVYYKIGAKGVFREKAYISLSIYIYIYTKLWISV